MSTTVIDNPVLKKNLDTSNERFVHEYFRRDPYLALCGYRNPKPFTGWLPDDDQTPLCPACKLIGDLEDEFEDANTC